MYFVIDAIIYALFFGALLGGLVWFISTLVQDVPEDVVNTGYMTQDQIHDYRQKHGLCPECGSPDVVPEGTHCDMDGLCYPCFIKLECEDE